MHCPDCDKPLKPSEMKYHCLDCRRVELRLEP